MKGRDDKSKLGQARCPGQTFAGLLAQDTQSAPEFLKTESPEYLGSEPLSAERYTSAEFFQSEQENLWPRVWQFAAREEDIPEPGDTALYDLLDKSFMLTRQPNGDVKAFYNACLHRGRLLRSESGYAQEFKCPFHGFTWAIDGALKSIPCNWDFEHLTGADTALPEVRVARWGGYIFINEDDSAPSFEEWARPLTEHFARWRHEDRVTTAWVGKIVAANWKVAMEAFLEAWHTLNTHSQLLPFTGDANTQYDLYGDSVSRALTPFAVASPHLDSGLLTEQEIIDQYARSNGRSGDIPERIEVPLGASARSVMAEASRRRLSDLYGQDMKGVSDSEVLDALVYNLFPNFGPWGGFLPNIVYRWKPWRDQDHCLMEVRILTPLPPGELTPRSAPMRLLGVEESWMAAADVLRPPLARVLDQDMANLPLVQRGLKALKTKQVRLGDYQECRIRQFHRTLDKYLTKAL